MSNDLTLEKLEIAKRVSAVETKLDVLIAEINADKTNRNDFRNRIERDFEDFRHVLIGNGQPGIVGKVAKLMDYHDSKQKHIAALWVASIGAFIKIFWDSLHGK